MLNPTSPLPRGEEVIVQLKNVVLPWVFCTLSRAEGEMGDFFRTLALGWTLVLHDSGLTV